MNRTAILTVGENTFLTGNTEWDIISANSAEAAIEKFHQLDFDAVVITNMATADALKLKTIFTFQKPEIIVLQNNDNATLANRLQEALQKKEQGSKHSFSIVDDALKNAMLPINIQ